MTKNLIRGDRAVRAYDRLRAIDAFSGQAFDAAGGTSYAFLMSQLELIDPNPVKPLQAVTHPRDITVKFGGGLPEWVSAWALDYASSGGGTFGLQATNNSELAEAQGNVIKGQWPVIPWGGAFTIKYLDLKRMEAANRFGVPPPITLQQLFEGSIETVWVKALDLVTYKGWNGYPGLINNVSVPATVVVNGGSGTQWSTKTPSQILDDFNFGINQTVENSGYDMVNGAANHVLIPYTQFAYLTRPMSIGGVGYESTLAYIKKNCVAAAYGIDLSIYPLPNPWISGTGLNGTDRAVFYRNTDDDVQLNVPQPKTLAYTIPSLRLGYSSFYWGAIANVMWKRTTTAAYLDGI